MRVPITDSNANVDFNSSSVSETAPDADPGQGDRLLQAKAARQHQHDLAVHAKEPISKPKTVTAICRGNWERVLEVLVVECSSVTLTIWIQSSAQCKKDVFFLFPLSL